ncbi:MAG: hypothetical protein WDA68_06580 [Phycisphaerae bacterium]
MAAAENEFPHLIFFRYKGKPLLPCLKTAAKTNNTETLMQLEDFLKTIK